MKAITCVRNYNRTKRRHYGFGAKTLHAAALLELANNPELIKGNHEHYEQVRVLDWLYRHMRYVYEHTHATPNGGLRGIRTAIKMVAEGQKKGYPDLSIDLARGGYHGMRIEMKQGNNRLTPEQIVWMTRLTEAGYYCFEARSADEAIKAITEYVDLT
ncbi:MULTISPECIES: VRR-NUC domain-containing protein [Enterobacteriaceae]|uniref:VRR-NUC domain-containing protein n=1 Tax=Enterobacteriaceae TaxID=543 RepID=UPI001F1C2306|nr:MULTISPECIES: VRR-NUC domain-containing protein [Enterobacteriaceae]MCY5304962.1 VRR-NUC domain-containing protein [Salmonella enterica subsp. enterica serovar 1,4,[5],12:i:-]MDZ9373578.1 VRR-NUC domain-containing protein [Escherichia coli]MCR2482984.1 VRR-NUC domain-containing protein [Salmonella enterica]MDJ2892653.1 VRR-NUC domain-containing protein [Salmonella enterica]MDR5523356.1 VRR-NUC domain-containing protein [Salmonella enterica subsp. enterica serovar Typhimurium]